jgi:hypothetical protein
MLTSSERRRLLSALALLRSPHAGERDAAGAAALRILGAAGVDWAEIIPEAEAKPRHEPHDSDASVEDWRSLAASLLRWHSGAFNLAEQDFLSKIGNFPSLSPKQTAWLHRLAERARRSAKAA